MTLDIFTSKPVTAATFHDLAYTSLMQDIAKEPVSGCWFVTQNQSGDPYETTHVSRLSPQGVLLDTMVLTNAGHGTTLHVEKEGADYWIYLCWSEPLTTGGDPDFVKFKYVAGATRTRSQTAQFTVLPKFGLTRFDLAVDLANDRAATVYASGDYEFYTLRRWSDMKAGTNDVLATIDNVPSVGKTFQGFATHQDYLYVYTGLTAETNVIDVWQWSTGQKIGSVNTDRMSLEPNGEPDGGYHEPEGACLYTDPHSGEVSLLVGVSSGPSAGLRTHRAFAFSSGAGADRFLSEEVSRATAVPPWKSFTGSLIGCSAVSGYATPAYRIWGDGKVEWQGRVAKDSGSWNASQIIKVGTIPAEARPNVTRGMATAAAGGSTINCRMLFGADGTLQLGASEAGGQTAFFLDGLCYYRDSI